MESNEEPSHELKENPKKKQRTKKNDKKKAKDVQQQENNEEEVDMKTKVANGSFCDGTIKALSGRPGEYAIDISRKKVDDTKIDKIISDLKELENKVVVFNMSNNNLSTAGMGKIMAHLAGVGDLTELYIGHNKIGDDSMDALIEIVTKCKRLEILSLRENRITSKGFRKLSPHLLECTSLKSIDLYDVFWLDSSCLGDLIEVKLKSNAKDINIGKTRIRNVDILNIADEIQSKKMEVFALPNEEIYGEALVKICELMKEFEANKTLKEVKFKHNRMGSLGGSALFNLLKSCDSLKRVTVSGGSLDEACAKDLGELLQESKTLEFLDLSYNNFTDNSLNIISPYLLDTNALQVLILDWNRSLSPASVPVLKEILNKTAITSLTLFGTKISEADQEALAKLSKLPIEKRDIFLPSNTKSAAKIA